MFAYEGPALQPSSAASAASLAREASRQALVEMLLNSLDELRGMVANVKAARDFLWLVVRHDEDGHNPLAAISYATDAVLKCDSALLSLTQRATQLRMRVADLGGTVPSDWVF